MCGASGDGDGGGGIPIPGVRIASPWQDYGRPSQLSPSPPPASRLRSRQCPPLFSSGKQLEELPGETADGDAGGEAIDTRKKPKKMGNGGSAKQDSPGKENEVERVRDPMHCPKRHRGTLAISSIEPPQLRRSVVEAATSLRGFRLIDDFRESTRITHLVLGSEKRTLKVLLAIVHGAWLLDPK